MTNPSRSLGVSKRALLGATLGFTLESGLLTVVDLDLATAIVGFLVVLLGIGSFLATMEGGRIVVLVAGRLTAPRRVDAAGPVLIDCAEREKEGVLVAGVETGARAD